MDFADAVNFVVTYEKVVEILPFGRSEDLPRPLYRSLMTSDFGHRARMRCARSDLVNHRRRARLIDEIRKAAAEHSCPGIFNILPDDCVLYHCDDLDDCEKIRTDLEGIPSVPDHQVVPLFASVIRDIREFIESCDPDAINDMSSQMDETDEVQMLFCGIKL